MLKIGYKEQETGVDSKKKMLRALVAAVSLSVSGCGGFRPIAPITEFDARNPNKVEEKEYCYNPNTRSCQVITRVNGNVTRLERIDCQARKINGALCRGTHY